MDADGLGDLGDGVLPPAVRAGRVVHAAHRGGLPGVQLGLAAPGAPAGGLEAFAGAFDDQLALELVVAVSTSFGPTYYFDSAPPGLSLLWRGVIVLL